MTTDSDESRAMLEDSFRALLFDRVAAEDRDALPAAAQRQIAAGSLTRFAMRRPGIASVTLSDVAPADTPPLTIIEIVNDDMPFLLASTLAELTERGLAMRLVAHPILAVRRDQEGRLTALGGLASGGEAGSMSRESLIHIHLAQLPQGADRDSLSAALAAIHADARLAVTDWQPMRETLAAVARRYRETPPLLPADEIAEAVQFLDWLLSDNFSFLGLREYRLDPATGTLATGVGLGILTDPERKVLRRGDTYADMTDEVSAFLASPAALIITKTNRRSTIHRRVHMDYVGVKLVDEMGRLAGELMLVGLFTATAYTGSTRLIPYIRHKVAQVLLRAGFDPASHSGKALINVLENYPRDELFQLDPDTLFGFAMEAMRLIERPRIRALIRADRFDRFVSALVYVPKDRYDTAVRLKIGTYLAGVFEGRVSAAIPAYPEGPLARTHFIIGRNAGPTPVVDRAAIEAAIAGITATWSDRLAAIFRDRHPGVDGERLAARYRDAFGAAYREAFSPDEALSDIAFVETLSADRTQVVDLYRAAGDGPERASLKVFALGSPVPLSRRVPMLENLGFTVSDERTYRIAPADGPVVYLHDMTIGRARGGAIEIDAADLRVEAAFEALLDARADSDRFNQLVIEAGLDWGEVKVLRAYGRFLIQTGTPFHLDYLADALARHPGLARRLIDLFGLLFDPAGNSDTAAREAAGKAHSAAIRSDLDRVTNLDDDRILRRFLNLIEATVRTNAYQRDAGGQPRPTIAFKFESHAIDGLPLPRPLYEIFCHGPRVEGVHMRFGKVARGGIRWSDRPADVRTEILGLAKAQHVKNSVIVPVGAKGGFVPRRLPPPGDRDAWLAEGVAAYRTYIGALLDLTDTMDGKAVIAPAATVRRDGDDPYLVVAADKGTATFSDIANALSVERGHWLGDAFASGGSNGYDHKKMGITARGAWECVKRHFREIDIDIQTMPVTVVGVGDMSGDVFGNGMLLSPAIRLVAAFDHRDIFLDPAPDAAVALAERQRLFALPRSSWQDYDKALISPGGGVFPRAAKSIPLSPQVRAALGIEAEDLPPHELMQAILKAPVDLMWFGGIGTYIRASTETDANAGDRANDAVRIAAPMLRCKVIGEGANLGCTQAGRIEAARAGIRLNTDAIDNSAGVNTSDIEVNLKIALAAPLASGSLAGTDRNALLASMTDDVASLVLRNNYLQSLALSLAERRGPAGLAENQRLMQRLESRGRLDRKVEGLPSDAEITRRLADGEGASRPELAVLLAYAKLTLFDDLIASSVPDDPYFADERDRYFPAALRSRFADAVRDHPLRREIIATQLGNGLVNRCGPGALARFADETGADAAAIAAAYALARDCFDLLPLSAAIEALDTKVPGSVQLDLYDAVRRLAVGRMTWFLRNVDVTAPLGPMVTRFRTGITALADALGGMLPPAEAEAVDRQKNLWQEAGVPAVLAARIAALPVLARTTDAVLAAGTGDHSVGQAMTALLALGERLGIGALRAAASGLQPADRYEALAAERAQGAIDLALRRIVVTMLARHGAGEAGLDAFAAARAGDLARTKAALTELQAGGLTQARLSLAAGIIGDLARDD